MNWDLDKIDNHDEFSFPERNSKSMKITGYHLFIANLKHYYLWMSNNEQKKILSNIKITETIKLFIMELLSQKYRMQSKKKAAEKAAAEKAAAAAKKAAEEGNK